MKNLSFFRIFENHQTQKKKDSFLPFLFCLLGLYLVEVFIFWPGLVRPDSLAQLQQAQAGIFSDHHPPMMALYWSFLNFLYPGAGLLFLTHLTLLFASALIFASAFKDSRWRWFYFAILIWPQISFHSAFVLKDVGFTYSFLFVSSLLSLFSLQQRKFPIILAVPICILLFYGTAIKFQAAFILPCFSLWLAYCLNSYRFSVKVLFQGLLLFCLLFVSVQFFNQNMTQKKDYSWQLVKLYDLAGMSLIENKDLFPDFVKNKPFFTMEELEKRFNPERVDELVFETTPLLIKGKTQEQRDALWQAWFEAILQYPGAYLSHRWSLFQNLIQKSPIKSLSEIASHKEYVPPLAETILSICDSYGLITFFKAITSFKLYLPFMILYFVLGLFCVKRNPYAVPLIFLNLTGLTLLGVLFVFSMASDARYIYLTLCCFHFSHPFFFKTIKDFVTENVVFLLLRGKKVA